MNKMFLCVLAFLILGLTSCNGAATSTTEEPTPTATWQTGVIVPNRFFDGLPTTYQSIAIPETLVTKLVNDEAKIVPLPEDVEVVKEQVTASTSDAVYLSSLDFTRSATFTKDSFLSAVPVDKLPEDYSFEKGVQVGVIYDDTGVIGTAHQSYKVVLYENRAELWNMDGSLWVTYDEGSDFMWRDSTSSGDNILVIFVENGCWLCWDAGGRCGCLICWK